MLVWELCMLRLQNDMQGRIVLLMSECVQVAHHLAGMSHLPGQTAL